ncbi:MAG: PIG-L family deacetylase [Gemmatimonadaceae bacterium]
MLRSACLSLAAVLVATSPLCAQDRSAARLHELVEGLTVTPRVLIIGARPDDADEDLVAWLAREKHVQTGVLSLTRAESGPNYAGVESGVALGAIHVEEALAARRIDGGEQFFTRAFDFGPARSADEAFKRWNHDSLLANVVSIIRTFRPHVIIARFTADSGQEGHRAASAILAREAFDAAVDTLRFKRAAFGSPWSATALYEPGSGVTIDPRGQDAMRGESFAEMAARSRSQFRTMGFLMSPWQGSGVIQLRRVAHRAGTAAPAVSTLFGGVDTSFARLDSAAIPNVRRMLAGYVATADSARAALAEGSTSLVAGYLGRASDVVTLIRNAVPSCRHPSRDATVSVGPRRVCTPQFMELDASVDLMQSRADEALLIASGISFSVVADREFLSNRDTAAVTITAFNHGDTLVMLNDVTLSGGVDVRMTQPIPLPAHDSVTVHRLLAHLADAHPWWLWQRKDNLYPDVTTPVDGVPHADLMPTEWGVSGSTVPENIRRLSDLVATVTLYGTTLTTSVASVVYRDASPTEGVHERMVSGVPAVTLGFERALEWAQAGKPLKKQLRLTVRSFSDRAVSLLMKAPGAGGAIRFDSLPPMLDVPAHGALDLRVPLKGTVPPGRYEMSIFGMLTPDEYTAGFKTAQYPHLPAIHLFRNSTVNVQSVDVEIPTRLNVAYVRGVGEDTDVALKQLGVPTYVFNDEGLARFDLSDFTTIVIGPDAYETNRGLYMLGPRLAEFARRGGTLVVMSNPAAARQAGVLPFPVTFATPLGDRVTADDAGVRMLEPRNRLLTWPNVIRDQDWSQWVGARATGIPGSADARYAAAIEMHDAGERENRNSLLVATLGKGRVVYTSITFPQQVANGVNGAMRLFINVLSAGVPAETKVANANP